MVDVKTNLKGIGVLNVIIRGSNNIVKVGRECELRKKNTIFITGDGNHVEIGNGVYFDQNVSLVCCEGTSIKVGNDCLFAQGIRIRTSDQHPIYNRDGERINPSRNVTIGEHVWIGATCMIMKGVSIGDGSVIGINSMVTKNIPSNVVAVGSPCKVIKENIYWKRK